VAAVPWIFGARAPDDLHVDRRSPTGSGPLLIFRLPRAPPALLRTWTGQRAGFIQEIIIFEEDSRLRLARVADVDGSRRPRGPFTPLCCCYFYKIILFDCHSHNLSYVTTTLNIINAGGSMQATLPAPRPRNPTCYRSKLLHYASQLRCRSALFSPYF
jgi:hypothetical protein